MAKTLNKDGSSLTDRKTTSQSNVAKLLPSGLLNAGPRNIADESISQAIEQRLQSIDSVLLKFQRNEQDVQRNGDLTAAGKRRHIVDLGKDVIEELNGISESVERTYNGPIADVESKLSQPATNGYGLPTRSETAQLLDYWREKELRDSLRDRDPLQLAADYTSASASGKNDLLVSAIENSPVPLLSPDIIAKGKQARLKQRDPASAQRLSDLTTAKDFLIAAIKGSKQRVAQQSDLSLPTTSQGDGGTAA